MKQRKLPCVLRWLVLIAPLLLIAIPLVLHERAPDPAGERVVVITPHGEAVRQEFARAFALWSRANLGREIAVDYRTPGGSGDIERLLMARAEGAIRAAGLAATATIADCFDSRLDVAAAATTAAGLARRAWLASTLSVDHDVFWGGGEFPHRSLANRGLLIDSGVRARHPNWFSPDNIPQEAAGETIYDRRDRYHGACLSVFGIVSHRQRLAELGLDHPPAAWGELADPRLVGQVIVADPTRSAAVASGLERVIQAEMRRIIGSATTASLEQKEAGWRAGWARIVAIYANARSVADGASRPVREVVRGEAAAAMAIDFHGRAEAQWAADEDALSGAAARSATRAVFMAAVAGTSVSADPIALIRGAPNLTAAQGFIDFVLSPEGQRLWNYRPGTANGPQRYALRRIPVRRDVCTAADQSFMSDPTTDPYSLAQGFDYRPEWTGAQRSVVVVLVRACLIDPQTELAAAWRQVIAAGGPERATEMWAKVAICPVGWAESAELARTWRSQAADPMTAAQHRRHWTEDALKRYRPVDAQH